MRADYANRRTVTTLAGVTRLNLTIRRCRNAGCPAHKRPYRPEAEGAVRPAAPRVRARRHRPRRPPPVRRAPVRPRDPRPPRRPRRGACPSGPSPTCSTGTTSCWPSPWPTTAGCKTVLAGQGQVILAIDGLQPDVGHEVLWVIRDCSAARSCWPRACCRPGSRTWPSCWPAVRDALPGAGRRGRVRRPALDPQGGGRGAARGAAPAVPVPLPAGGGPADLRGRPARQEGAEEEGPRGPRDRAARWRAGPTRRRRWSAGTARRCGAR